MKLIVLTAIFFALVALLIYIGTEIFPKWLFLRRHQLHKDAFEQFDITDKDDQSDRREDRHSDLQD